MTRLVREALKTLRKRDDIAGGHDERSASESIRKDPMAFGVGRRESEPREEIHQRLIGEAERAVDARRLLERQADIEGAGERCHLIGKSRRVDSEREIRSLLSREPMQRLRVPLGG